MSNHVSGVVATLDAVSEASKIKFEPGMSYKNFLIENGLPPNRQANNIYTSEIGKAIREARATVFADSSKHKFRLGAVKIRYLEKFGVLRGSHTLTATDLSVTKAQAIAFAERKSISNALRQAELSEAIRKMA